MPNNARPWKEITEARPDTPERRAAYEAGRTEALASIVAHSLAELRQMRDLTQAELARQLGIAQPSLSAQERRSDWQVSTLRAFIEALGGRLEMSAVFDDIAVPVNLLLDGVTPNSPR